MKDIIVTHELIYKEDITYKLDRFINFMDDYESIESYNFKNSETGESVQKILGTKHIYGYKLDENPYYIFYDPIHKKLYSKDDLEDVLFIECKVLEKCKALIRK